ncbi:MAG: YceI family protein [Pseudomonadota bacterium]
MLVSVPLGFLQSTVQADAQTATRWTVEPGSAQLEITGVARGFALTASFERFQTEIAFDPAALDATDVRVTIDTASWTSSLPAADEQVLGADWLAVALAPTARWVLADLAVVDDTRYRADGMLTIRDRSAPVAIALTLDIDAAGTTLRAAGTASFDRRDFALGATTAPEEGMAGYTVDIRFEFTARRTAP